MHAKRMDKIATGVLYAISGIIVAILASLILYILVRGLPHVSWHFLTGKSSSYQAGGGIGIQLYNSFFLLVITLVISFPLSLGAGIYLSEYAKKGSLTNLVRTCIEILSSLPSVVVGLFGYLVFVVQFKYGFSIISGALALTVFNLPQMTRNIEDSLQHVHHTPVSYTHLAWLKKHDVPFKEHNIMTSPLSKQELTSILALTENGTDDII